MEYVKKVMTLEDAVKITGWSYSKPYDFYNMDNKEEIISELRSGVYEAVYSYEKLFGFFCTGESAQILIETALPIYKSENAVDIGLGICPDMTGKGLGRGFVSFVIGCIRQNGGKAALRLTVADFNKRAITVYEALGFKKTAQFIRPLDSTVFIVMMLEE